MGRHKYPRRVEFVEALPMGPSGKVLKREIVRTLERRTGRAVPATHSDRLPSEDGGTSTASRS
jgi:acyl-coenzyme A synthetase/AMP-(fatty) acid ligase